MYKNITNIQPILFEDKDNDQLTTIQQMKRQGGGGVEDSFTSKATMNVMYSISF